MKSLLLLAILGSSCVRVSSQLYTSIDGRDPALEKIDEKIQNLRIHHRDLKVLMNTSDALGGFRSDHPNYKFRKIT